MASTRKEQIYQELLVLRCRKNDTAAQEELIRMYEKRLFYFLRRLVKQEEDAWDLLQETWMKVFQNLSRLNNPEKLTSWLYTIARNTAMSYLRKQQDNVTWSDELDPGTMEPGNSEPAFGPEDMARVHASLEQLSLPHREVLTLFFLEDLPLDEIAGIVGVPAGTIKSRLYYAKQQLRELLTKEESSR